MEDSPNPCAHIANFAWNFRVLSALTLLDVFLYAVVGMRTNITQNFCAKSPTEAERCRLSLSALTLLDVFLYAVAQEKRFFHEASAPIGLYL